MKIQDLKPNQIIACRTKADSEKIVELLREQNLKWLSHNPICRFDDFKDGIGYRIDVSKRVHCAGITFYKNDLRFESFEASDFFKDDFLKIQFHITEFLKTIKANNTVLIKDIEDYIETIKNK